MSRKLYPWFFLLAGILIGLIASGRIILHARPGQHQPNPDGSPGDPNSLHQRPGQPQPDPPIPLGASQRLVSVQDALLLPYHFPFGRPTSLSQVCLRLKQDLGVRVALDIAALERQDVKPEDTVQLELDGIRLKTGLKLLLDQVGLTYHAVPEDNLLILTDREGSDDPLDRIWEELRKVHRDLHDIQDAVDDANDALYGEVEEEGGPRVRKPTIIEEKPDADDPPAANTNRPRDPKSEKSQPPRGRSGVRPTPTRVPLAGPRHPL